MTLSEEETERYARQLALSGWGAEAQERLRSASAIVVGAGGLGAPASAYLAAAGVGRIGVVDSHAVELSSLHRQTLHFTPEIGAGKAESAALKLGALNPEVQAEPYPVRLEEMNAAAIVAGADVALECSNAPETRSLVGEACLSEQVPLVVAGFRGLCGFLLSIGPGRSACHRCALSSVEGEVGAAPERGAVGAMAGALGALQAVEALKLLTGVGRPLLDRVMRLDAGDMTPTVADVLPRAGCPACGEAPPERQSG